MENQTAHLEAIPMFDAGANNSDYRLPVMGDTGETYIVTQLNYHGTLFACSCPDFFYRGSPDHVCKHIKRLTGQLIGA